MYMYSQSLNKSLGNKIVNLLYDLCGDYSVELLFCCEFRECIYRLPRKKTFSLKYMYDFFNQLTIP